VIQEATQTVKRLKHHPSVVIFTGNNEDYQFAETQGTMHDAKNMDPEWWLASDFPARHIYEIDLKNVVESVWPGMAYKPGSPYGGKASDDRTVGDVHQWNGTLSYFSSLIFFVLPVYAQWFFISLIVWHGTQEPYQKYGSIAGRFVSEFGMQGYPALSTVRSFFNEGTPLALIHPTNAIVDNHNKADGFAKRLIGYMFENVRFALDMEDFVYVIYLLLTNGLLMNADVVSIDMLPS
jgi:beta-mannosidase